MKSIITSIRLYGSTASRLSPVKWRSGHASSFWQRYPEGEYHDQVQPPNNMTRAEQLKSGFQEMKHQIKLWKAEVKEHLLCDPAMMYRPGEVDLLFNFDNPEELKKFVTSCDRDFEEGFSHCSLTMSKSNRALFSGRLDTKLPKMGDIYRTGYCAMRTPRKQKSFFRDSFYDWSAYNTLVLKVRGDGRSYMINLTTQGYFDITWNDIFQHPLYTRGGPYWQIAKIPFSKFFFSAKGRIQDKQCRVPVNKITHFGIALGDKITGDFALEIDHIGLEFDPLHDEESAYEMYKTDRFIVGI